MPTKRSILIFSVSLIVLAGLAWLAGWSLHAMVAGNQSSTPTPSITPTVTPSSSAPPQPTTTSTAASPQKPARATSTAAPTTIPTPQKNSITVQRNEGLYEVCRRHCPGRFDGPDGEQILDDYARRVADHNGLPWGWWGPSLEPGQELEMLPCPEE